MKLNSVSIIFPTHNSVEQAIRCLKSINKLKYPISKTEVIVIDNGSSDGTSRNIKRRFPYVRLISNTANTSFAKSVNQGLTHATGEYVLITNDDVIFETYSLTRLVDYFTRHPEAGIIGGKIFSLSDPSAATPSGYFFNPWTGALSSPTKIESTSEPDWIQGCSLLVRRKVLDQIGLLDEHFTYFFEDFDLCIRAKRAGWKIVYLPTAKLWHGGSSTSNRNIAQKYAYWYQSKFFFVLKQLPLLNRISILLFQTLLVMPYRTLILHDGRFIPFLKGTSWNVLNILQNLRRKANIFV